MTPELNQLIETVFKEINAPPKPKYDYDFKMQFNSHSSSISNYYRKSKTFICLSNLLNANTRADIEPDYVKFVINYDYKLSLKSGDKRVEKDLLTFINSLVLSSKAKKYLISYLIYDTDEYVIEKYFIICLLIWLILYTHSKYWPLMKKNFNSSASISLLIVLSVIFGSFYPVFSAFYINMQNTEAICKAVTKGRQTAKDFQGGQLNVNLIDDDYYEGAIEYNEKSRQRNIAVRNMALSQSIFSLKRFAIKKEGHLNPLLSNTPSVNNNLMLLHHLKKRES